MSEIKNLRNTLKGRTVIEELKKSFVVTDEGKELLINVERNSKRFIDYNRYSTDDLSVFEAKDQYNRVELEKDKNKSKELKNKQ